MLSHFHKHFNKFKPQIRKRLREFSQIKNKPQETITEEMAFCVFAANSSAKMGLLAVELLRPVLKKGTLDDYKNAVHKKVRFYNKRSEYMHHNKIKLNQIKNLINYLDSISHQKRREFIVDNFKGFGMKEASHFLRNIGYTGYCIIDKHVLNVMKDLGALDNNTPPKNEKAYLEIENKIKEFALKNNYDIDELDLALWSYKTGEIIK